MRFQYPFQVELILPNYNKIDLAKIKPTNNKGFTLVELMISVAMTGIILAAVYSVYTLQQKTYIAQDQVIEMQQNIRAAILTMIPDIRMAGYDPLKNGAAVIKKAYSDALYFTIDRNEDGNVSLGADDTGEHIAFDLYTNAAGISVLGMANNNTTIAINETPVGSGHFEAAGHQPIAENIEAVEFLYTMEDGTEATAPGTLSNIRTITISILARAARRDAKFVNNNVYTTAFGDEWGLNGKTTPPVVAVPFNDSYRRRLLITTVSCRNMGL